MSRRNSRRLARSLQFESLERRRVLADILNGQELLGSFSAGGQNEFQFVVSQDDYFRVAVGDRFPVDGPGPNGNQEPRLRLIDPNGVIASGEARGFSSSPSSADDASIQVIDAIAGTYTAIVTEDGNDQDLSYRIRLLVAPDAPQVTLDRDEELSSGEEVETEVPIGGMNVHRFTVEEGHYVQLNVGDLRTFAVNHDPELRIVDPLGNLMDSNSAGVIRFQSGTNSNDDASIEFTAQTPGTYSAFVAEDNDQDLAYRIRLLTLPGEPIGIPGRDGTLQNGQEIESFVPLGGFNVFRFDATESDSVKVRVAEIGDSNLAEPEFQVRDADGVLLSSDSDANEAVREVVIPADGTYFIVVTDDGNNELLNFRVTINGNTIRLPQTTIEQVAQTSSEDVDTLTFDVNLSAASATDVTAPFTVTGTATTGDDFTISTSPVVIPAGQTSATVTITVVDDTVDENDETVIVTLGTPTGADLGSSTVHTTTITDNDDPPPPPMVSVSTVSQSGSEDTGTLTLGINLSAASATDVTIPFTVTGTATTGDDFTIPTSPVTIPAGQTSATVTITVVDDTDDENDETVIVTLGTPTGADLGTSTVHTATITDNDDPLPLPTVSVSANDQAGTEDVGTLTFDVNLSAASATDVTVPFTVTGTATTRDDFTITTSPVTIHAGLTSATVTIDVIDDTVDEPSETVIVSLGTPTGASLGTSITHTASVLDNDSLSGNTPPTIRVEDFSTRVNVPMVSKPLDRVTLFANDAETPIDQLTFSISSSNPQVIQDSGVVIGDIISSNSGGQFFSFSITPETNSVGHSEITITVSDGELSTSDTFVLTVVDSTPVVLAVERQDPVREVTLADELTFRVTFNEPVANVDASDFALYRDLQLTTELADLVTVTQENSRVYLVRLSGGQIPDLEGSVTIQEYPNSSGSLPVNDIRDLNGNAVDRSFSTLRESFLLRNDPQTVSVSEIRRPREGIFNSPVPEVTDADTLTFVIDFTSLVDQFRPEDIVITGTTATVTNITRQMDRGANVVVEVGGGDLAQLNGVVGIEIAAENQIVASNGAPFEAAALVTNETYTVRNTPTSPATVELSTVSQVASEGSGALTFELVLSGISDVPVNIPFTVSGTAISGNDFAITASPVVIPAGQTSATVTITVVDDTVDENDETVIVTLGTPTGADLGTSTVHTATITDNDDPLPLPTVSVSANDQAGTEDVGTLTFDVNLSAASATDVTVPFAVTGTATTGDDFTISTNPVVIPAGQTSATVTITVVDDTVDENDETVIVTLGTPTGAGLGSSTVHTTTITDNDVEQTGPFVSVSLRSQTVNESEGSIDFVLQLSEPSDVDVTIPFTVSGSAGSDDFTAPSGPIVVPAGQTSGTITISLLNDGRNEGDETITVTLGQPENGQLDGSTSVTISVVDDDPAPRQTRIYVPSLVARPHVIPGDEVPTAIIFQAISETTVTVTPIGSASVTENVIVLDDHLLQVSSYVRGVATAQLDAGGLYAIIFEPQIVNRMFSVRSSSGADSRAIARGFTD